MYGFFFDFTPGGGANNTVYFSYGDFVFVQLEVEVELCCPVNQIKCTISVTKKMYNSVLKSTLYTQF